MKKIYTVFFVLALTLNCHSLFATTYMISVTDNEFSPAELLEVHVGDTITWFWEAGSTTHTTTSTTIPDGAISWDSQLDHLNPAFTYIVMIPGSYDYECTIHASMGMVGHFNATEAIGINFPVAAAPAIVITSLPGNMIQVTIDAEQLKTAEINIYNLAGNLVKSFVQTSSIRGTYYLGNLPRGLYFVRAGDGIFVLTRKVVVQ